MLKADETGRSAAWLARLPWAQEVAGSSPAAPIFAFAVRRRSTVETATMGRVLVEITVENLKDLYDAERGLIQPEQIRRVTI
jgi:hypothetical protein